MMDEKLFKNLNALGFPLMEVEEAGDANLTLAQVVRSGDVRLLEGFPLLLANSSQSGLFDYGLTLKNLKTGKEKEDFRRLVLLSLVFYKAVDMKFPWSRSLFKKSGFTKSEFDATYKDFVSEGAQNYCGGVSFSRMKPVFDNYYKEQNRDLKNLSVLKDEFHLEYALAQVFSPKQKELFFKKLKSEKLSKTEKEYYSRVVRKKVAALANEDLHLLAKKVA